MAGRRNRSRGWRRPAVVLAHRLTFFFLRGQCRECTGFTGTGYTNLVGSRIAPKV